MINQRVEQFRREAEKARLRAENSPEHREAFLVIAADWEALAREAQHLAATPRRGESAKPRHNPFTLTHQYAHRDDIRIVETVCLNIRTEP